jgi:hypothetical protein
LHQRIQPDDSGDQAAASTKVVRSARRRRRRHAVGNTDLVIGELVAMQQDALRLVAMPLVELGGQIRVEP